jgi:hypothetical protein
MGMIDVIATVWLTLAVIGFVFAVWAVYDALGDRQWLRDSGLNGSRRIIAHAAVRNEQARLLIMSLFIVTGVATLFRRTLYGISPNLEYTLIYGTLIAGLFILVLWTVQDRRARNTLILYEMKRGADNGYGTE